jgi:hypothetical protein
LCAREYHEGKGQTPHHPLLRITSWHLATTSKVATRATASTLRACARREAERLASLELQFRSFPLQRISTAHVAAVCRPFPRAGWTVKDLKHAIDWRPNTDARYHHDGASGVDNVGAWLKYRLGKWVRPDGGFYRSPSQKLAAEQAQRVAERLAVQDRRDRERAERASYIPPAIGLRERVARHQEDQSAWTGSCLVLCL